MYKHLFGPVSSRRLGISLGVDLVEHKICSLNCVYCECGETTDLTIKRKEYVLFDNVVNEITDYFQNHPDPDYITFSGSGEPCLNTCIGDVIDFIKQEKPKIAIAVLTNGTFLYQKDVRNELLNADLVIPSLDAASEIAFQKINRPSVEIDLFESIKGLQKFKTEYKGKFILEVLILPGWNDKFEDLKKLKDAIGIIQPDKVQLNTLDRPGVVLNLSPLSFENLKKIARYLGGKVEIITSAFKQNQIKSHRQDIESAIFEMIHRRPCTLKDLVNTLSSNITEINKYLTILENNGQIKSIHQERGLFYHTVKFSKSDA